MISWKGLALPSTAPIVISTAAAAKSAPTRLYACVRLRKREMHNVRECVCVCVWGGGGGGGGSYSSCKSMYDVTGM